MENTELQKIFDTQFQFPINQEVRHRGDNKSGMSSDMGLFILRRTLEENSDDYGNIHYTKNYICRMIRFSGSGDLAQFKESELMSIEDFNKRAVQEEQQREDMRNDMYTETQNIFKSFGVRRSTEVYLKNGDSVDKSNIYKVSGFSTNKECTLLHLRRALGEGKTADEVRVKSKNEFELVVSDIEVKKG
jgi:hypothetical protein